MNGDVGPECCGVVCPATPEDAPTSVGALGGDAPLQGDAPAKAAARAPEAAPAPPQQNGEVTPKGSGGQSASSPAPPSPIPPTTAAPATTEGEPHREVLAPSSETQGTQTTPSQTPTPGSPPSTPPATPAPGQMPPPPPPPVQPLSREQIKQLVAQQVEYFFSRENLSSDPYLISQMDSNQYVPIYILANCTQFKTITKDHSIIVEALKESPFVQLDEEKNRVRPNYKRCIVILREIPESTPIEEIESVFKSEECPKVVSCEFVHNSSWYVTFESDEDAQKAYWYLRGVVKTFKDKPILARIKTKPISRMGCLSVLPSYGGKAGGGGAEAKEGQGSATGPPSAQPSPGAAAGGGRSGGPGTPAPPGGSYAPSSGVQRFMFSTQQSVNPSSFTYPCTAPSSPMPTAYFYPNVMQWTPPGGFYDINTFLQFNGLSPQGTFTPQHPGPTLRYPPGRRSTKHRDGGRYDKGEGRHGAGPAGQGNPPGHYPRPPHHHHHRPHPALSPSQAPPHRPPSQAPTSAPTPPPLPPPPPPPPPASSAGPASVPPQPHPDSFAQSDFPLTSQPGLYTSFSPPAAGDKEVVTVSKPLATNPATTITAAAAAASASPPPPPQSPVAATAPAVPSSLPQDVAAATPSTEGPAAGLPPAPQPQPPLPPHLHQPPHPHPRHNHHHHHHHNQFPPPHHLAQGLPGPPPPPPPHRGHGNYPPEHFHHPHHHPPHLHQQGPRPVFDDRYPYYHRGRLRRRPRGREDEVMGGPGRGGPPQRGSGPPHQLPGGPDSSKQGTSGSQEGTPAPPPPPPQFDLEAASFPPLPGSDEPAVVVVERRAAEPMPGAWGDSQRFSDVMKGNPKPRPPSLGDPPVAEVTPTNSTSVVVAAAAVSTTATAATTTTMTTASPASATAAPSVPTLPTPTPATPTPTTAAATTQQPSQTTNSNNTPSTTAPTTTTPTTTTTTTTTTAVPTSTSTSTAAPQLPTTASTTTTNDHNHPHQHSTASQTPASSATTTPTPTTTTTTTAAPTTASTPKPEPRPAPRDQRPTERRPTGAGGGGGSSSTSSSTSVSGPGAANGPRERREFSREYPQRNQAGREFRGTRDSTLRTGKENRPIRPPREDKMDADGWITKGSRESRAQRESREQWERGDSCSSSSSSSRHHHHHHHNNNNNNNHHLHQHHHHHHHHLVNGDSASPPSSPKPQKGESSKPVGEECTEAAKGPPARPLNNNDGEHKTSWAKMALASKDHMERLAAELKEKEEQEKMKKQRLATTRPQSRPQEKVVLPRERDGKLIRRDAPPRDPRGLPGERGGPIPFRPRDAATPKSPK